MTVLEPVPLEKPDFSKVAEIAVSGLKRAIEEKYMDDDLKSYIYEAVMEAVYGKGFWEWNNNEAPWA